MTKWQFSLQMPSAEALKCTAVGKSGQPVVLHRAGCTAKRAPMVIPSTSRRKCAGAAATLDTSVQCRAARWRKTAFPAAMPFPQHVHCPEVGWSGRRGDLHRWIGTRFMWHICPDCSLTTLASDTSCLMTGVCPGTTGCRGAWQSAWKAGHQTVTWNPADWLPGFGCHSGVTALGTCHPVVHVFSRGAPQSRAAGPTWPSTRQASPDRQTCPTATTGTGMNTITMAVMAVVQVC